MRRGLKWRSESDDTIRLHHVQGESHSFTHQSSVSMTDMVLKVSTVEML